MKQLHKLTTGQLKQLYYEYYNVTCNTRDLIDILDEANPLRLRQFFYHEFERDFSKEELENIVNQRVN